MAALRAASSASVPVVFTPVQIDGGVNVDGGVASSGNDPVSAVRECLNHVDDPSKVTLDIILLNRIEQPTPEIT